LFVAYVGKNTCACVSLIDDKTIEVSLMKIQLISLIKQKKETTTINLFAQY